MLINIFIFKAIFMEKYFKLSDLSFYWNEKHNVSFQCKKEALN